MIFIDLFNQNVSNICQTKKLIHEDKMSWFGLSKMYLENFKRISISPQYLLLQNVSKRYKQNL